MRRSLLNTPHEPSESTEINRAGYNAIAAKWDTSRTAFFGQEQRFVDTLLEGLPAPSVILDLGCGTGRPIAEYLLAEGHMVTGVDQSAALLERARARFPQATGVTDGTGPRFTLAHWIECRIEDFEASDEDYHAVIAWDSLFHIERSQHEAIIRRIARWLMPGGLLMLTCGGSDSPAFTDTMHGETFFYDSHPPETMLKILRDAGFEPILAEFLNPPTGGRDKGRFGIIARRRRSFLKDIILHGIAAVHTYCRSQWFRQIHERTGARAGNDTVHQRG